MRNILGIEKQELLYWLKEIAQPAYRADQILQWIYRHGVDDFSKMSNLPSQLTEALAGDFNLRESRLQQKQCCDDGTIKLLLEWTDGALTETVLITEGHRRCVCVSSQVGCPVQCAFCASGLAGLERSLEVGEIVEQVIQASQLLENDQRISNVVVMGMGEPFANYENTLKAVKILNAHWGLDIGARHITISTIGIPQQIRKIAHEPIQVTLAVSLHAGDDELRAELVPWSKKYNLKTLFEAINYYYQQTHREVTLEYVMLEQVNCRQVDAENLAQLCRTSRCNVNLINYNPVDETGFKAASAQTVRKFEQYLQQKGVNVHLRKSRGATIDAACGQLRRRDIDNKE